MLKDLIVQIQAASFDLLVNRAINQCQCANVWEARIKASNISRLVSWLPTTPNSTANIPTCNNVCQYIVVPIWKGHFHVLFKFIECLPNRKRYTTNVIVTWKSKEGTLIKLWKSYLLLLHCDDTYILLFGQLSTKN